MKKATEAEKKKTKKQSKAYKKAKEKSQAMDIRRLAISNNRKIVKAFKEILSDSPTIFEAFNNIVLDLPRLEVSNNAVLDLSRFEASNNAVLDFSGPESSNSTPKGLLGNNVRFSNSQKKKATQQTLVECPKNKASTSKEVRTLTLLLAIIELIRPSKRKIRVTANAMEKTSTKQMSQIVD